MKRWTNEDIDFMKKNYPGMSCQEIANKLGHPYGSTAAKLSSLGLTKKIRDWTDRDILFLKNNYFDSSLSELSQKLNRTESAISTKCYELGLIKSSPWSKDEDDLLRSLCQDYTYPQIARLMNRTQKSVALRGHKLGIKKSPYYCNYDFFSIVDTQDKAYWLGFIYADGWIHIDRKNNSGVVGIKLKSSDIDHLKKFNKSIQGNYKITIEDSSNVLDGRLIQSEMCCIQIYSRKMVGDLEELGVTSDKTYVMQLPKIRSDLFRHFVRGYFDGDGCLSYYKNTKGIISTVRCDFTSASKIFLEQLRAELYKHGINSYIIVHSKACKNFVETYKLHIAGGGFIEKYLHWIYDDANIYLDRKYDRYLNRPKKNDHEGLASQK